MRLFADSHGRVFKKGLSTFTAGRTVMFMGVGSLRRIAVQGLRYTTEEHHFSGGGESIP